MAISSEFIENLRRRHTNTTFFPSTSAVARLATRLLLTLFPEQTKHHYTTAEDFQRVFQNIEKKLIQLLSLMPEHISVSPEAIAKAYMAQIPEIYRLLNTDIQAMLAGDPAAKSEYEIIRTYPGFYAIAFYRMAHGLYKLNVPLLPRMLTEYAHSKAGIDIHPGANIGEYFFIDHGTGVVIGETTQIGNNVKIYQCVTLGALSVSKDMASKKRHPTVENDVVIYSGATILGGETVVGQGSVIGGNVWLTKSIPPYTKIYHQASVKVQIDEITTTEN